MPQKEEDMGCYFQKASQSFNSPTWSGIQHILSLHNCKYLSAFWFACYQKSASGLLLAVLSWFFIRWFIPRELVFICSRWIRRWCTKTLVFAVSQYSQLKKRPRWNQGTLNITSSHPEAQPCDTLGWLGSLPSIQWFHVPGNTPKPAYPAVTRCGEWLDVGNIWGVPTTHLKQAHLWASLSIKKHALLLKWNTH